MSKMIKAMLILALCLPLIIATNSVFSQDNDSSGDTERYGAKGTNEIGIFGFFSGLSSTTKSGYLQPFYSYFLIDGLHLGFEFEVAFTKVSSDITDYYATETAFVIGPTFGYSIYLHKYFQLDLSLLIDFAFMNYKTNIDEDYSLFYSDSYSDAAFGIGGLLGFIIPVSSHAAISFGLRILYSNDDVSLSIPIRLSLFWN